MNKQEIIDAINELDNLANIVSLTSSAFGVVHGNSLRMAISALGKQTEKTPEANYNGEGDLTFECKVCEQTVNEGSFYCWYCGQNLLDEQWKTLSKP